MHCIGHTVTYLQMTTMASTKECCFYIQDAQSDVQKTMLKHQMAHWTVYDKSSAKHLHLKCTGIQYQSTCSRSTM